MGNDFAGDELRLGVIGAGAAARRCHLPAIAAGTPFRLTALVDLDPRHAQEAAQIYATLLAEHSSSAPGPEVMVTDDLAAALDDVDAVVVATAHHSHAGIAERVLAAGKHVLMEKPFAVATAECERIEAAARAGGAVVLPAHVRRLFPNAAWVRTVLADGRLGAVHTVTWREGRPYSWPVTSDFMFRPGGGLLADSGPHVFDMLLHWFGPRAEVVEYRDNTEAGSESELRATIRFGDVTANVELSRLRELPNQCVIEGDRGSLTVGIGFTATYELRDTEGEVVDSGPVPVLPPTQTEWVGLFRAQLANFAAVIRGVEEPLATAADGAASVRLIESCLARRAGLDRPWQWPARPERLPAGRVAVTGGTGFIGSHVVERLVEGGGEAVAVARDLAKLARLSHLDQRRLGFAMADILDVDGLTAAFQGCDVVVHTVYGGEGDPDRQWAVGVEGTRAAVTAAARAGVRRFVHVGTVAVYDSSGVDVLDETAPTITPQPDQRDYGAQKLAADQVALATGAELGIEVVCVQPTVVYGPGSPSWTLTPIRRLREGQAGLPSGDVGVCNAVHVADVADALLFAAAEPSAAGRTVLVSGAEPTTWGAFYDSYRDLLGLPHPAADIEPEALQAWERPLYADETAVSTNLIGTLGWRPRIKFDEGIAHVTAWARWAGLAS